MKVFAAVQLFLEGSAARVRVIDEVSWARGGGFGMEECTGLCPDECGPASWYDGDGQPPDCKWEKATYRSCFASEKAVFVDIASDGENPMFGAPAMTKSNAKRLIEDNGLDGFVWRFACDGVSMTDCLKREEMPECQMKYCGERMWRLEQIVDAESCKEQGSHDIYIKIDRMAQKPLTPLINSEEVVGEPVKTSIEPSREIIDQAAESTLNTLAAPTLSNSNNLYLPEFIDGVRVLMGTNESGRFLVDNTELDVVSIGLGYRLSRDLQNKSQKTAAWGSVVKGTLSKEWLAVDERYAKDDLHNGRNCALGVRGSVLRMDHKKPKVKKTGKFCKCPLGQKVDGKLPGCRTKPQVVRKFDVYEFRGCDCVPIPNFMRSAL